MNLQIAAIISLVTTVVGGLAVFSGANYAWIGDQTGYAPVQPIAFSHKTHAKDNAIPCEYCHSGARKGPAAGVPPANVCMNCHSQVRKELPEVKKIYAAEQSGNPIEWVRIHRVPDFVRFDHSAHVSQGVACQTCHGPVQEMARVQQTRHLSMGWCVGCHRQYARGDGENGRAGDGENGRTGEGEKGGTGGAGAPNAPQADGQRPPSPPGGADGPPSPPNPGGAAGPPSPPPNPGGVAGKLNPSTECSACHY